MTKTTDDALIDGAMARLDDNESRAGDAHPPQSPRQLGQERRLSQPDRRQDDLPERPNVPSLALQATDPLRRPAPRTLCEQCPNAVWFVTRREIKCYCRVMYLTVWSTKDPVPMVECDGIWIATS
jgi:hypothetical protein